MKQTLLLGMLALLSGCVTTDREVTAYLERYYSRAEVDAINAQISCRQLARNLVQIARCNNGRFQ
jgi:hypothetical protein